MQIISQQGSGFEKASSKLTQEQLDRPIDEVVAGSPAESVPETTAEVAPEPEVSTAEPAEEDKVPKSRFLTMHQRAIEAERALRQFEAERESEPRERRAPDSEWEKQVRDYFTTTFGDTEKSRALADAEISRLDTIEERAAERAYERLAEREQIQEKVIEDRVSSMDLAFEELSVVAGKEMSDDEQIAILDIVEKYSPKDRNGKIPEEYLMSLDDAYEIYQLQNQTSKPNRSARNAVAALSGARSQGAAGTTSDADWRPGQRGRWENKLPK